ncbi:MAG TPA: outer membrane protein assembly factor BamE [Methylomirabilota bacterium]|nr:outer membrane protein assembly factor BamE [Methylomirabilota bacterium]
MRNILCIIVAAALLCGCAGTYFTFDKAREVQVGMTESEVQKIMGRPYLVTTHGVDDIWVYSFATGFGSARTVSFILTNGKVSSVPRIPASFNKAGSGITAATAK